MLVFLKRVSFTIQTNFETHLFETNVTRGEPIKKVLTQKHPLEMRTSKLDPSFLAKLVKVFLTKL